MHQEHEKLRVGALHRKHASLEHRNDGRESMLRQGRGGELFNQY